MFVLKQTARPELLNQTAKDVCSFKEKVSDDIIGLTIVALAKYFIFYIFY